MTDSAQTSTAAPVARSRPRYFRLLARAGVGILVVLLIAEVALRTIGFGNPVRYVRDADCGFLPAPNQYSRRFFALNTTNAFSMRSGPIEARKPPGTFRVMFLGDSVTYGTTHVDQSRLFTSLLQDTLPNMLGRKVEVLNASCGAWGPANELAFLKTRGTFDSDLVVMVLNTTDPLQPFSRYLEGDINYPTGRPALALSELVSRYILPRVSKRFVVVADRGSLERPNDSIDNLPDVLAAISDASKLVTARGGRFGLAFVPFRTPEKPQFEKAYEAIKDWARQNSTPFVDMRPDIEAFPPNVTHIDGSHLRPEGHIIVARRFEHEIPLLLRGGSPDAARNKSVPAALAHGRVRE